MPPLRAQALALPLVLSACAAQPLSTPQPRSRACRQPARTVQQHAWDTDRRAALEHALAPLARDDATATRIPVRLDALATAWVVARADACHAADFTARAACQNTVLAQQAALVRRLQTAPAATLAHADAAVDELEAALTRCDRPAVLALHRASDPEARIDLAVAELARSLGDGAWITATVAGIADPALAAPVQIALAWGSWLQGQPPDLSTIHPATTDLVALAELATLRLFTRHDDDLFTADALAATRLAFGDTDLRLVAIHRELARRHRLAGAETEALAALQAAIAVVHAHHADTPLLADLLQHRGDLEHHLGDYTSAEQSHRAALVAREQLLGRDHLTTAESLHGLANDLEARGQPGPAITYYARAAEILGARRPGDPITARTYNNLGRALYTRREFTEARRFHTAALEIRQRVLGQGHPDTATSINNLAAVARAEGDLPGARALFEQALAIRERILGPDHPYTAVSLNNLAEVLTAEAKPDDAIPLHERALAIRLARFGPDHPETARSQHNLATLLLQQHRDLPRAEQLLKAAATTRAARLGPDHPETRSTLLRLRELTESHHH